MVYKKDHSMIEMLNWRILVMKKMMRMRKNSHYELEQMSDLGIM